MDTFDYSTYMNKPLTLEEVMRYIARRYGRVTPTEVEAKTPVDTSRLRA